ISFFSAVESYPGHTRSHSSSGRLQWTRPLPQPTEFHPQLRHLHRDARCRTHSSAFSARLGCNYGVV
ncbi:hypothetical protein ANCCAN_25477, partial [Ancylostoma caninum]